MKAKIEELSGRKYYGTNVEIFDGFGLSVGFVVIWLNPTDATDYIASERELEGWNKFQLSENPDVPPDPYEYCDNHYETTMAYEVAKKLEEAING